MPVPKSANVALLLSSGRAATAASGTVSTVYGPCALPSSAATNHDAPQPKPAQKRQHKRAAPVPKSANVALLLSSGRAATAASGTVSTLHGLCALPSSNEPRRIAAQVAIVIMTHVMHGSRARQRGSNCAMARMTRSHMHAIFIVHAHRVLFK